MNHNEQKWLEQQQAAAELQYGATSWGDFIAAYKYGEATGVKQNEQDLAWVKQLCSEQEERAKTPKAPDIPTRALRNCVQCGYPNSLFIFPRADWSCCNCSHLHGGLSEKTTERVQPTFEVVGDKPKVDVDASLRKQRDAQLRGMFT